MLALSNIPKACPKASEPVTKLGAAKHRIMRIKCVGSEMRRLEIRWRASRCRGRSEDEAAERGGNESHAWSFFVTYSTGYSTG